MGQGEGQARPAVGDRAPEQIKAEQIKEEIEETREELGDTVAAVTEKADVKKQAKAKASDAKQTAGAKADAAKQKATAKKDAFVAKAKQVTPESVEASADQARHFAQQNPVPIGLGAAFAAGLVAGWMVRGR
jgi:hypothetical protein